MNEFSFYHIVNEHSRKSQAERIEMYESEVKTESAEYVKYPRITPPQTRNNTGCIVRNVFYCLATIATAICGLGAMALFVLIV